MMFKSVLAAFAVGLLTACGGGGGSESGPANNPNNNDPVAVTAPGGLYVGYYQEDAGNNPEDPMPGSFYLQLPEGNANFSGEMSFTYIGCQTSNVGTVSGTKNGLALNGNWSGSVDGRAVGGPYSGRYDPTTLRYSGTYQNAGGKIPVVVENCIEYDIAAFGTWEMFPVEARSPADFAVSVSGGVVSWNNVQGVALWLCSVYDSVNAQGGSNAVTRQVAIPAINGTTDQTIPLAQVGLISGRSYVLAVTAFDAANRRVGYTSMRYIAP